MKTALIALPANTQKRVFPALLVIFSVCWANSQKKGNSTDSGRKIGCRISRKYYEAAHLFNRFNFPGDTAVWGRCLLVVNWAVYVLFFQSGLMISAWNFGRKWSRLNI